MSRLTTSSSTWFLQSSAEFWQNLIRSTRTSSRYFVSFFDLTRRFETSLFVVSIRIFLESLHLTQKPQIKKLSNLPELVELATFLYLCCNIPNLSIYS